MTALWVIVLCGVLSIVYAIWATASVLKADAGNPRMQEIAGAVREGAQAYLRRQYTTIGIVGIVIFELLAWFLGMLVAVGFAIGAMQIIGMASLILQAQVEWDTVYLQAAVVVGASFGAAALSRAVWKPMTGSAVSWWRMAASR